VRWRDYLTQQNPIAAPIAQVEALGEALLDFGSLAELEAWLVAQGRGLF
jgi:Domain of unknown function (DUF4351)